MMFRLLLTLLFTFTFTGPAMAQRDPTGAPPLREAAPDHQDTPRITPKKIQMPEVITDMGIPREREIIIFAEKRLQTSIASVLRAQNLPTLEKYTLKALDSVLVLTRGKPEMLTVLRRELPDAEIDWNSDLIASKGPRLYAKDKIKWPDQGTCLDNALKIPIGLIDGSIDRAHPAFAGQGILEKNFLDNEEADKSHATAIASILTGNAPEQGFDGLLTGAKLYSAVALRRAPDDKQLASIVASVRGLDWLLEQDVRLINVSLAGDENRVLVKSFEAALVRGALVFAAAGNNGADAPPAYPAAIDGVFAITAIDAAGHPYKQANQGDYIDVAAPGVDIWVATPKGGGAYKSGTSYAVPFAVGVSALNLSNNKNISRPVLAKLLGHNQGDLVAKCLSTE